MTRCLPIIVGLFVVLVAGPPVHAIDGEPRRPPIEAEPGGVDLVRLRLLRMETRRWQRQGEAEILEEDSFDDWAFGGSVGAQRFQAQLDRLLDRKLAEIRQVYELTDAQERKLRLAGKGDLRRVLDLVEDCRQEFDRVRTDPKPLADLYQDLRLVELRVAQGPFEIGSLFEKTLRKLLQARELVPKRRGPPASQVARPGPGSP